MLKNRDDSALRQKAYNYFEPKSILHDVWVIHFTNLEGYEDTPPGWHYNRKIYPTLRDAINSIGKLS